MARPLAFVVGRDPSESRGGTSAGCGDRGPAVRRLFRERFGARDDVRRVAYCSEAAFRHRNGPAPGSGPPDVAALGPPDAPLIVAVSRQDPRKGVDVLLGARVSS